MLIAPGQRLINSHKPTTDFGTVGGPVRNAAGNLVMLTCYHCVFMDKMKWDEFTPNPIYAGVSVAQNGVFNEAAAVERCFRDGDVDAAMIHAQPGNTIDPSIPIFGKTNGLIALSDDDRGTWLRKYGATTQDTYGQFLGFTPMLGFRYETETSIHYLHNLIRIGTPTGKPFSEKGDSGAFVLNAANQVAGIIVMGDGTYSYAIQATLLESRLTLQFQI
jgi:hypothetical protein